MARRISGPSANLPLSPKVDDGLDLLDTSGREDNGGSRSKKADSIAADRRLHFAPFRVDEFAARCSPVAEPVVVRPGPSSARGASKSGSSSGVNIHHRQAPKLDGVRGVGDECGSRGGTKRDRDGVPLAKSKKRPVDRSVRVLACPFYKRDPVEYIGCLERDLGDISAVVQHLWRCHKAPIRCSVCTREFRSRPDHDAHVQLQLCLQVQAPAIDFRCVTEDQFTSLRARRALPQWSGLSESKRWYVMWVILFGDSPYPDSPYVDIPVAEAFAIGRRAYDKYLRNHTEAEFLALLSLRPEESSLVKIVPQMMNWWNVWSVISREDNFAYLASDAPHAANPAIHQHQAQQSDASVANPTAPHSSCPLPAPHGRFDFGGHALPATQDLDLLAHNNFPDISPTYALSAAPEFTPMPHAFQNLATIYPSETLSAQTNVPGPPNGDPCYGYGDNPPSFGYGDNPPSFGYGDNSYGDTTYGDTTYGDTTYGDTTYGDTTYGDTTYGDTSWNIYVSNNNNNSLSLALNPPHPHRFPVPGVLVPPPSDYRLAGADTLTQGPAPHPHHEHAPPTEEEPAPPIDPALWGEGSEFLGR